jgi:flagellar biogenesis protein FliO
MHNTEVPNMFLAMLITGCGLAFIILVVYLLVRYENRSVQRFKTLSSVKPTKYRTKTRGWPF